MPMRKALCVLPPLIRVIPKNKDLTTVVLEVHTQKRLLVHESTLVFFQLPKPFIYERLDC